MNRKIDKLFRIWYVPILFLIISIALAVYTLQIYLNLGGESDEALNLSTQAVITFLAAFVGVFLSLLINRNLDSEKDRRTLAFTLGLVWHELLYNDYLLKEIRKNLDTSPAYDKYTGNAFKLMIYTVKAYSDILNILGNMLTNTSFLAAQNSGGIRSFNNDELLNVVINAYDSIQDIQLKLRILQGNCTKDSFVASNIKDSSLATEIETVIKQQFRTDFDSSVAQVDKTLINVDNALKAVDRGLSFLGVTVL